MIHNWLLIGCFFFLYLPAVQAATGEINDAEFVIEKQTKNEIGLEKKIFFKAPLAVVKAKKYPPKDITSLMLQQSPFGAKDLTYSPFSFPKEREIASFFSHYCRLGMSSLSWFPYVECLLSNCNCLQGIWSANVAFMPEFSDQKWKKGDVSIQGKYKHQSFRIHTTLGYQVDSYNPIHLLPIQERVLHDVRGQVDLFQVGASRSQDLKIACDLLMYQTEKIGEHLYRMKYRWLHHFDRLLFKMAVYSDIEHYINNSYKKTQCICSAIPQFYLPLPQNIQLKTSVQIAYQNQPIEGVVPTFDLYPMVSIRKQITQFFFPYLTIGGMGVGGSVCPLYLHDLALKNPFIQKDCKLLPSHRYFSIECGSRGSYAVDGSYHWYIAYRRFKNLARMIPTGQSMIYGLLYNPHNCDLLKSSFSLVHPLPRLKLKIMEKATFCYSLEHAKAIDGWYAKPKFKLGSTIFWMMHPKLHLTSNMDFVFGITQTQQDGTQKRLDNIWDLNIGVDYLCTSRWMVFVKSNNVFNRDNTPYTGYRENKFNIAAGIQYTW